MSGAPALPSFQAIPGAAPMPGGAYDLASLGYEEQEYLLEGVARSYRGPATRPSDGRWEAELADEAPYVTRFVVRRPIDRSRASGTVVVEWNNVSAGMDVSPDWSLLHRHLSDQGHVWVGLSAQAAGIHGGGIAEGLHLKLLDPLRYAPLAHPGDDARIDDRIRLGRPPHRLRRKGEETRSRLGPDVMGPGRGAETGDPGRPTARSNGRKQRDAPVRRIKPKLHRPFGDEPQPVGNLALPRDQRARLVALLPRQSRQILLGPGRQDRQDERVLQGAERLWSTGHGA